MLSPQHRYDFARPKPWDFVPKSEESKKTTEATTSKIPNVIEFSSKTTEISYA
jgi:hypothetical protein